MGAKPKLRVLRPSPGPPVRGLRVLGWESAGEIPSEAEGAPFVPRGLASRHAVLGSSQERLFPESHFATPVAAVLMPLRQNTLTRRVNDLAAQMAHSFANAASGSARVAR